MRKENNNWGKKKSLTVLLFDDVVGKIMGKDKSLESGRYFFVGGGGGAAKLFLSLTT
jgi:hypothetical protein|tara:strand:+ start:88 stop:258 length:171 start_codon:yes stop_codon:yes gene_type:complete